MSQQRRRYPGLNYFTTEQKDQFFGRDAEKEDLLALVQTEKIVTLFGKSGYGKSSLIRAGLIPILPASREAMTSAKHFCAKQSRVTPVRMLPQRRKRHMRWGPLWPSTPRRRLPSPRGRLNTAQTLSCIRPQNI